nr:uncharacterized protein LOC111513398 [Leptinotarsa decemlineata]
MKKFLILGVFFCAIQCVFSQRPYFIKKCYKDDEAVNTCLRQSTNFLIANIRRGIPELDIYDPEPIIIDEIQLALGSGPDGYRATFRNIEAYGVSNISVVGVRSDIETGQYQLTMYIPKINVRAKYESSGVLILIQATGGGNYWGEYEAALNLFINSNSQELLREMKPHVKKKLLILIRDFADKLFNYVPYDEFLE